MYKRQEWERYAWIKGREVTGGTQVTKLLKPFVFRKYLDFGAFASMRDLKIQIQRDVNSKGMQDNIKLGRGGIREIEFIAQVFQLIRGGQEVSLQIMPTLAVLALLKNKGLLPEKTVAELTEAYVYLRHLELVSYTHLDVYKRQGLAMGPISLPTQSRSSATIFFASSPSGRLPFSTT